MVFCLPMSHKEDARIDTIGYVKFQNGNQIPRAYKSIDNHHVCKIFNNGIRLVSHNNV